MGRSFPSALRFVSAIAVGVLSTVALNLNGNLHAQNASGETNSSLPSEVSTQPHNIARLARAYGKIPLGFEANQGQTDNSIQFLARGSGFTLFLRPGEAVLSLRVRQSDSKSENPRKDQPQ